MGFSVSYYCDAYNFRTYTNNIWIKMTRKEKLIAWSGVIAGAIIGAFIGGWITQFTLTRTIVCGLAFLAVLSMAVPVIAVLIEIRNENKSKFRRSYPANWGYDKQLEN
jgi:uncharacterized membrane protein YfcA